VDNLAGLIIGGIALGPIVVALVELVKALGLPPRYWTAAMLLFSMVAYGLVLYTGTVPEAQTWIVPVLQIIITILTALGYYKSVVKTHAARQEKAKRGY
jgi:ABC-type Na+ efflux pump permease subunit